MKKAYAPRLDPIRLDPDRMSIALWVSRALDVPLRLLGVLPLRGGRTRSAHRHRNKGRA